MFFASHGRHVAPINVKSGMGYVLLYLFWSNLYQKILSLAILGALGPHFNRDNGETWGEGIRTRNTLLCA